MRIEWVVSCQRMNSLQPVLDRVGLNVLILRRLSKTETGIYIGSESGNEFGSVCFVVSAQRIQRFLAQVAVVLGRTNHMIQQSVRK